jgi:hypothetical protein
LGNGAAYLNKTIHCQFGESIGGTKDHCWPWLKQLIDTSGTIWKLRDGAEKDEYAERIDLPDSTHFYKVKEIIIPIKGECRKPMLLHIYSSDPNSEYPGVELLTKSVRFEKFLRHHKAVLDLSDENILLHGTRTFFISFGFLWEENRIPCVTNIIMKPSSKGNTYSRTLAHSEYNWSKFGNLRTKENEEYAVTTFYAVRLDEMK